MMHNTHVYFASKLYGSTDHLLTTGSFLPDIAVTGIINWEGGLHTMDDVEKFGKYIKKNNPDYLSLYKGVFSHYFIDHLTHKKYKNGPGFAYRNNDKIAQSVKKYYGLDKEKSRGIAHNYIETGVDILLCAENPGLSLRAGRSAKKVDINKLSGLLGLYFKKDRKKFDDAFKKFFGLLNKYKESSVESWSSTWYGLEFYLGLKHIDSGYRKDLIENSIRLVKPVYGDFLDYALLAGKKVLKNV